MASKVVEEIMKDEGKLELTPLIDVAFLIIIFFMCLPFKTLDGKLQAFLPTDKGIQPIEQDPVEEFMISVHILARKEAYPKDRSGKIILFGPKKHKQKIMRPTEFWYKCGQEEKTKDIDWVANWIQEAYNAQKDKPDIKIKGEIKASHKVPHKFVVAILNQFASAGLDKVDFYGTAILTKELKDKPFLPYPKTNYVGSG